MSLPSEGGDVVVEVQWQSVIAGWLEESVQITQVAEVREWSEARVLRLEAVIGAEVQVFYAKLARSGFEAEWAVYSMANGLDGFPAPPALKVELDGESWLLIKQAKGRLLAQQKDPQVYGQAVRALAAFHEQSWREQWGERTALEGLTTRLAALAQSGLAQVSACVSAGVFTGVDVEELQAAQRSIDVKWPQVEALLLRYPTGLVHGDCHSGNMFVSGEQLTFIDWGSAAIAPGLLDLVGLLDVAERMQDGIGEPNDLLHTYWEGLSADAKEKYGELGQACEVLRLCRALLEIGWFTRTSDDYGQRVNREVRIILASLSKI